MSLLWAFVAGYAACRCVDSVFERRWASFRLNAVCGGLMLLMIAAGRQ